MIANIFIFYVLAFLLLLILDNYNLELYTNKKLSIL